MAKELAKELESLEGIVEGVTFSSEKTGFTVFSLESGGEIITVVGEIPGITVGEIVILKGKYSSHPTYGQQFKAEVCERKLPTTAVSIRKYLASGAIKGVSGKLAEKIVDKFGEDALDVIEKTPIKLTEINGISAKKAKDIAEQYKHIFGIRSVMQELAKLGVDTQGSIKAWKKWGMMAPTLISENIYLLSCEEVAVPFAEVDAIALRNGVALTDSGRMRAGLEHVLRHNLSNGHSCLPTDKLIRAAAHMMEVEEELLEDTIQTCLEKGYFIAADFDKQKFLYIPAFYEGESYIAVRISLMLKSAEALDKPFKDEIDRLEEEFAISYAPLQRKAIEMALQNRVFILTGGPGTGKTTTLNAILALLNKAGEKVVLAAPTGRAAKRMSEVTGGEAKTIHRLLEVDFRDGSDKITFKRDAKNPLRCTTIILDEVSMVDTMLLQSLIKALQLKCRLILVGDPDQLPSIGAGNILKDLIESDVIPCVLLDKIFRQASESQIVANAHKIVKGENPNLASKDNDFFFLPKASYSQTAQTVVDLCAKRLPAAYGYNPQTDIQVICPSRVGGLGTVELNKLLQEKLNPQEKGKAQYQIGFTLFREKDKVMQVKNNYDINWQRDNGEKGTGVFNGDIGIITMIDRPSQSVMILFDDRLAEYSFDMMKEVEHGWAITVHKSQGSEFDAVIMPLMNYHEKLYYRNILYTAVTRAKKIMIIIGKQETVYRMVENHRKVLRYTNLDKLLLKAVFEMDNMGL